MRHHRLPPPAPSTDVADFLADREGLAGGARERFRRLLYQYGGFRDQSREASPGLPIFLTMFLGLLGLIWEWPSQWNEGLIWIEYGGLSAYLIGRLRQEARQSRHIDRETHWEAYRLFLRPIIVNEHPGLLDRNVALGRSEGGPLPFRPVPTFRRLIHEPGRDFWWAMLVGCWLTTGVLVFIRHRVLQISWPWSIAFPAAGVLLGLVAWRVWRRLAYLLVKRDSRLAES